MVAPGSSGSLSNDRCVLRGVGSSTSSAGNDLTVVYSLEFTPAFAGEHQVYLDAIDKQAQNRGWKALGTWTVAAPPPQAPPNTPTVTILPGSTGSTLKIRGTFSDPNGAGDLNESLMLIGQEVRFPGTCSWRVTNAGLELIDDLGVGWLGPVAPGGAESLANQYCMVSEIKKATSGTTLDIDLTITFTSALAGVQTIWVTAADNAGAFNTTGWTQARTWTVPGNQAPSTVSIAPTSGQGLVQSFTASFTDPNGYQNIRSVQVLVGANTTGTQGCYAYYERFTDKLFLQGDDTTWQYLGTSPSDQVSNSRCTLQREGTGVAGSGNNLALTLNLQFKAPFHGAKNVYGRASDNGGVTSNWQATGTWNVSLGQYAPQLFLDTPAANAAVSGIVNIAGWAVDATTTETAINRVQVLVDNVPIGDASYGLNRPDVCQAPSGPPGCPNVGYSLNWDTAGLTTGIHTIRVLATDSDVPTPRTTTIERTVTVVSAVPAPPNTPAATILPGSSGNTLKIRGTFSDPNGSSDLKEAYMMIGQHVTWPGTCSWRVTNAGFELINDLGNGWMGPVAIGGGSSLSNQYCTVSGIQKTTSAMTLDIDATITFTSAMAGVQNIWVTASDNSGAVNTTGWTHSNTWTVAANQAPSVVSILPNSGRGLIQKFTAEFTDPNGYQNIRYVQALLNVVLDGASGCYAYYERTTDDFFLTSDGGVWQHLGRNPSDAISNSRCTLHRQGTIAIGSGNNLTLTLNLQFNGGSFAGAKNMYGLAVDNGGASSNWRYTGGWDVGSGVYAPDLMIDSPAPNATVSGVVNIAGWAIDAVAGSDTGISRVQALVDNVPIGDASYGFSRVDVCQAHPGRPGCPNVGYGLNWDTTEVAPGNHTIRIVATDSDIPTARSKAIEHTVTVVRAAPTPPDAPSATILPESSGNVLKIRGIYSDPNGANDLTAVHMTVGQDSSWLGSCGWHVTQAGLHLINNRATDWLAAIAPGTGATTSNDFCTVSGFTKSVSGTSLIVDVTMTLKNSMAGTQNIFLLAGDSTGYLNPSGWTSGGTWTVPGNQPPAVATITPASGRGMSQTFTAKFTDVNGGSSGRNSRRTE